MTINGKRATGTDGWRRLPRCALVEYPSRLVFMRWDELRTNGLSAPGKRRELEPTPRICTDPGRGAAAEQVVAVEAFGDDILVAVFDAGGE